jgi:hypothetical protein
MVKQAVVASLKAIICVVILWTGLDFDTTVQAAGTVTTYAAPSGASRSYDFAVSVDASNVDLYGDKNGWNNTVSFGYFDFTGTVSVSVTVNFPFASYKLAPESLGLASTRTGNTITFALSGPTNVTLVLDGNYQGKVLHLFGNAPEMDIPSPTDPNVIYFGPGYHDLRNTPNEQINVGSGKTLYIAGGAVVNGRVVVHSASGAVIRGRGILTMNWRTADGYWDSPMFIENSSNIVLRDIIVNRRASSWSGKIALSNNVTVSGYKVVSPTYASTDGLNIINSHDITYNNVFFRTADDCIAIKGGVGGPEANPAFGAPNYNITIQNSQFWSDANNVFTLGAETQAAYYDNIQYKNIDVLYSFDDKTYPGQLNERAVFGITSLHGTQFRNILYENIRVEQCERLINQSFEDSFWFGSIQGNQTWPGYISGVTFRNVTVKGTGNKEIRLHGYGYQKQISNIRFENVTIGGQPVTSLGDRHFDLNPYVKNVFFHAATDEYSAVLGYTPVQGENQWSYKEWNGSAYSDMTWDVGSKKWRGAYAYGGMWSPFFIHPDTNDAVKAWKAPKAGTVQIKGRVFKWDITGGDGVRVKIMKNNTQLWPSSGWHTVAYNDNSGLIHGPIVNVAAGDHVYFIVNQNGNSGYDTTVWDAAVSYRPTYNATTDFQTYQGAWNWKYQQWNGAGYSDMAWHSVDKQWRGSYTYNTIWNGSAMHPDTNDTARVWMAPMSGTIRISGNVKKAGAGGDGVLVKIMKNGTQVWPASGYQFIAHDDLSGVYHDVSITVAAGDNIYFLLNKNGNNGYDTTIWSPDITYS